MWFVPNCISYPSFVRLYGVAITPALLIKMSKRVSRLLKMSTAALMLVKEVRSSGRWMISQALGIEDLMSRMADSAFEAVRAPR
jgi:hypothetical protein